MPEIYIIAGANGAGKSTISKKIKSAANIPIIDPDAIAKEINSLDPEQSAIVAGKAAINLTNKYVSEGVSFGIETTLAGKSYLRLIQDLKRKNWIINLIYIGIENPMINIQRIKERVSQGGHHVPMDDIYRRYYRSLNNLSQAIKYSDLVTIYDNSDRQFLLIATIEPGTSSEYVEDKPIWYQNFIGNETKALSTKKIFIKNQADHE